MKHLILLADLLSDGGRIHGYDNIGLARKRKFRSIGVKAMKELAIHLNLIEYNVNFNWAGMACSGDLRLMGFDRHGRGIYIHMNRDFCHGREVQVLYRTISNMQDFTGGPNHYFPVSELRTPELIRGRMINLYNGGKDEAVNS